MTNTHFIGAHYRSTINGFCACTHTNSLTLQTQKKPHAYLIAFSHWETLHTRHRALCLGIHPPDNPHTHMRKFSSLSRTHTWHGCQLSPSSPEVINHLFTVSFQTIIEDCSKPLCLSLKPLSSFIITLVTCVTAIMCVFMFGRCSFGFFLLHMIVHNYISQLTVTFTPIKVNLSMF